MYPAKGQSADQQQADEGDCHAWAVENTGIDPVALADQSAQQQQQMAQQQQPQMDTFCRAFGACLERRGYTVN